MTFKKETILWGSNSSVTVCPERGGMVTSLILQGTEVLYMDEGTFADPGKSVRGGIPFLFPNAGPIESPLYPGLKQHGFVRSSSAWAYEVRPHSFVEQFESNDETLPIYPYHFVFEVEGKGEGENKFTLACRITNKEVGKDLPVSMGLHPYFPVKKEEKRYIPIWQSGGTASLDNPGQFTVSMPGLGTLRLTASPIYKRIWVWGPEESDFICIEPVMRDVGGLLEAPERIKPGETLEAAYSIELL